MFSSPALSAMMEVSLTQVADIACVAPGAGTVLGHGIARSLTFRSPRPRRQTPDNTSHSSPWDRNRASLRGWRNQERGEGVACRTSLRGWRNWDASLEDVTWEYRLDGKEAQGRGSSRRQHRQRSQLFSEGVRWEGGTRLQEAPAALQAKELWAKKIFNRRKQSCWKARRLWPSAKGCPAAQLSRPSRRSGIGGEPVSNGWSLVLCGNRKAPLCSALLWALGA